MHKLLVFNQVTVDGYFSGLDGDISWAHTAKRDPEFDALCQEMRRLEACWCSAELPRLHATCITS